MKIKSIRLERYKRFVDKTFDFTHPENGKPLDLIVFVGENGCGKSSILQAIAATLGTATRQIYAPSSLTWPGFVFDSIDANHRGRSQITLNICFNEDEVKATQEYYQDSDYNLKEDSVTPSNKLDVELFLKYDDKKGYIVKSPSHAQYKQFSGRNYAFHLIKKRRPHPNMFQRVGGVFWYHEHRTFSSLTPYMDDDTTGDLTNDTIRRLIGDWFVEDERPKVSKFREIYERLFPDRTLSRVDTAYPSINKPVYFKVKSTEREYELGELSGGERAILPVILDFVRWDICNSVVLIDELELHLHPPLQQAFLATLDHFGINNQFIITTHSDYVASIVPPSRIVRVDQ